MQVNEQKWSDKTTWLKFHGIDETVSADFLQNVPLMGNFTETTSTAIARGAIRRAVENNYTEIGKPLDASIAYCGLGIESPYSTIKYYNTKTFDLVATDNNTVTDFAFCSYSNLNTNTRVYTRQATGSTASNYNTDMNSYIWYFDDKTNIISSTANVTDIVPMVQFNLKNFILVIRVKAKTTKYTTDNNDFIEEDLDTYMTTYAQTHPYIVGVSARVKYGNNDINNRNGDTKYRWGVMKFSARSLKWKDTNDVEHGNYVTYQDLLCPYIQGSLLVWGSALQQIIGDNDTEKGFTEKTTDNGFYRHQALLGEMTVETYEDKLYWYHEYNENTYEKILNAVACFGLFFTPSTSVGEIGSLTDNDMYMGVLENGVGHGKYTQGIYNVRNPQFDWNTTADSTYNPAGGGGADPNTYRNTSGFNNVLNAPRDFNKRYVLSDIDIRTLNTDFFSALTSVATDDVVNTSLKTFYTNNPVDCIVSLKWFPFNLPQYGSASLINLGAYATTVSAYQYVGSGVEVYNLGECEIFPHFGITVFGGDKPCFLDYEPYTHIECIVPYCGTVRLNPSDVMGKTVKIMMTIDVYTGACVAYIMCDGLTIDTISGTISVNLPISGVATADLDAQIHTATMNYKSAKIQEATTVISSALKIATSVNPAASLSSNIAANGGTISNVVQTVANATQNLRQTQYDLEHINVPFKSVGTNSALNGAKAEQFCSINITRPILHGNTISGAFDVDKFAHTNGYACLCNGEISDFTGYTQISDVDLSGINATNEEKMIIMNLLKGGVYL